MKKKVQRPNGYLLLFYVFLCICIIGPICSNMLQNIFIEKIVKSFIDKMRGHPVLTGYHLRRCYGLSALKVPLPVLLCVMVILRSYSHFRQL